MSKEHKMTYDGKKYVTKKSRNGSCNGCAFIERGDLYACNFYRVMGEATRNKCLSRHYKDGGDRIWVEDKSKNRPAKAKGNDCYWIVEELIDQQWIGVAFHVTRSKARDAQELYLRKTRIRKFVPAK
jgi:hypothetical protein